MAENSSTEELLRDAATRAGRYLTELRDRRIFPSADAIDGLSRLDGPLPENGVDPRAVLALLDECGTPATVASAGGRYFGFVTGGTLPAALAAQWLAAAWDQNVYLRVMSPIAARLEDVSCAWLRELLHLSPACAFGFVTGATMANFTGLAAARHALLARAGWDVESEGLFGAPPLRIVVGAEVHASMMKAIGIAGLGRSRVEVVNVDGQGRMIARELPQLDARTIVCAQAGNVNTGAFDPIEEICERANGTGAWVHVDGAFGLWARASASYAHLIPGAENADSLAMDAHKWLNVPYDSGLAIVRDAAALRDAMSIQAAYLPVGGEREPGHYVPEASRRARGVEIWAALASLGRRGVSDMIDRTCTFAQQFAAGLRDSGAEILNEVAINQVLVSFGSDDRTQRVLSAVQNEGTCWCGGTQWRGRAAMRISVSSWATTAEDVDASIAAIVRVASAIPK